MRKILLSFCIILAFIFIVTKPIAANAEPAIGAYMHKTDSRHISYFLGSVTVNYDWDYYYSDRITSSNGYPMPQGLGIFANTYRFSETDKEHKFRTVVYRGITVGGTVGTPVGGNLGTDIVWVSDEFTRTLTYLGSAY